MKYIIMCGGDYKCSEPKHFTKVLNDERIIDRTIRLLKENGVEDIAISTNNDAFASCGVPLLKNENNKWDDKVKDKEKRGYWLDAYYPYEDSCVYIYGDVFFTEEAISKIVETANNEKEKNILFGSAIALNKLHKNWGEPFAYIVNDMPTFRAGIEAVKKLQDDGKLIREAITWELYRYLNNLDVNIHEVSEDTFYVIDDATDDLDSIEKVELILNKLGKNNG